VDISVIRRKSGHLRKNAVFIIDNKIFKSSLLKTVSQVTLLLFTGGTKLIGYNTNDVILVHSICKHTNTALCTFKVTIQERRFSLSGMWHYVFGCVVSKTWILTLTMKAVWSFETSVSAHQMTQSHISEHWIFSNTSNVAYRFTACHVYSTAADLINPL